MAGDDKPGESGDGSKLDAPRSSESNSSTSGRARHRRNRRGGGTSSRPTDGTTRLVRFEGKCEGLKGHVYDVLDHKQADAFAKTTKELAGYVGRTLKEGDDVRLAVKYLELPIIEEPDDPDTDVNNPKPGDRFKEMKWGNAMKIHQARVALLSTNMRTLYSLVIGQCSESMINKLESSEDFKEISDNSDSLALLKAIKKVSFHYESQKFGPQAMHESLIAFYNCKQDSRMTTDAYLEVFNNTVAIVEYCGGTIGTSIELERAMGRERGINDILTLDDDERRELQADAQERFLAVAFIMGADKQQFGTLMLDIENRYLTSRNHETFPSLLQKRTVGCFGTRLDSATHVMSPTMKWHLPMLAGSLTTTTSQWRRWQ